MPILPSMRILVKIIAILGGFMASLGVGATEYHQGDIAIVDPYSRPTLAGTVNGVAYLTLTNQGPALDGLLRAESPRAKMVQLHTHIHEGAVMRMRPVSSIDIAAGGQVILQPGGLHLMLLGVDKPFKTGEKIPLTLYFERAGTLTLELPVQ